jgi:hypothetical protein
MKDRSYDVRLNNQSYLRNKYAETTLIHIMCFVFYGVIYIRQLTFMIHNIIQIVRWVWDPSDLNCKKSKSVDYDVIDLYNLRRLQNNSETLIWV